jgi:phosphatidylserine/phosphatidylglycerophosphate/cardiolipin synthase-like enzyme
VARRSGHVVPGAGLPARRPEAGQRRRPVAAEAQGRRDPEQALERVQWLLDETNLAENRRILGALLRSDVQVRGDFNPKIFHQKFIIRDFRGGARPKTALLSGSANFTTTDTHRNLNNVFVFHDAAVCREYLNEFKRLREGQFGRGLLGDPPKTIDLNGIPVKIAFAPDHTPELELMKQLLTVRADGEEAELEGGQVWFAIFTFMGSSGIDDTLLALARGGAKIRGVLDRAQAQHKAGLPSWLKHENLELRVPKKSSEAPAGFKVRKLHHKTAVIDDRTVVAGSFNYTRPANDFNDENLFVIGSPYDEIRSGSRTIAVDAAACKDLATHVRAEIERIFDLSETFEPRV